MEACLGGDPIATLNSNPELFMRHFDFIICDWRTGQGPLSVDPNVVEESAEGACVCPAPVWQKTGGRHSLVIQDAATKPVYNGGERGECRLVIHSMHELS